MADVNQDRAEAMSRERRERVRGSRLTFREMSEGMTQQHLEIIPGPCQAIFAEVSGDESHQDIDIPDECFGQYDSFLKAHIQQCASTPEDRRCAQLDLIQRALVVLHVTDRTGLKPGTSVQIRALRLFALSLIGADKKAILAEADQLLEIEPSLSSVRDLKIITMFADLEKSGFDDQELEALRNEIKTAQEQPDADLRNAYATEFLIQLLKNENPEATVQAMKAKTEGGYAYYLDAAWRKQAQDARGMFASLKVAMEREPDNSAYKTTYQKLSQARDPLQVKGAFQITLSHGTLL